MLCRLRLLSFPPRRASGLTAATTRPRFLSTEASKPTGSDLFYENLGPRKNKGMLFATAWSVMTTCTFTFFQFIHEPAPADASLFVKIISSESWNFAGMLIGPIICYGNYKYSNYLVSEMTKNGDVVGVRTHNLLGLPANRIKTHNVADFVLEGYGKTEDLLEYRIANSNVRYIFNREPHVEELFAKNGGPRPMARPRPSPLSQTEPESIVTKLNNGRQRSGQAAGAGGGLKRRVR